VQDATCRCSPRQRSSRAAQDGRVFIGHLDGCDGILRRESQNDEAGDCGILTHINNK
jgi:hypothetical protein